MDFSKISFANALSYLSLLIALTSIIIPGITTWISKKYDLSLKIIEITKEKHVETLNRAYLVFQDFIEHSGKIVSIIDFGRRPSSTEIQKFESVALKCLIFLSENDRPIFDSFRITVKIELGQSDPRGTPTTTESIIKSMGHMFMTNGTFGSRTDVNDLYKSFNRVIVVLSNRLTELEKAQKQELDELQQNRYIRFLRRFLLKLSKGISQLLRRIKLKRIYRK